MLPILQIGGLSLRTPGLALLAGLWVGLEVSSREGMRRGISGDHLYNVAFYGLIAGVLGARLAFVAAHLKLYISITPWTRALTSAFALATGTEIAWAGLLIGLAVAAFFTYRWQIDPLDLADSLAPGVAIVAISIGLANLLSGNMLGIETRLPWAIPLRGADRHPTQVYFALVAALALVATLRLRATRSATGKHSGKAKLRAESAIGFPPGMVMQVVLLILSAGILLIEPLRADSPVLGTGIRLWMVVAVVMMVAMLAGFAARAPARSDAV
jgi:phosphatidylglycerol:prolipoprotein diacylglycerol transferase